MQIRFVSDRLPLSHLIVRFCIVIVAEAATEEIPHPTLRVFHIGRGLLDLFLIIISHHVFDLIADATGEVGISLDATAQVVTAIEMVTDPGESIQSHISLRMTEDVGITTAGEGIEDTAIIEVDVGAAGNQTLESAAVDELTLGHTINIASAFRYARITLVAIEIDVGAVFLVGYIIAI